jgi:CHASE3 domain sensor protein
MKAFMLRKIPKMAVNMACAFTAVLILIGISEVSYDKSMNAMEDLGQAHITRSHLQRLLRDVLDAETGQRGYLLTGDAGYLEPYSAAIADIGQTQDQLREIYAARADLLQGVAQLGRTVQRKLAEMERRRGHLLQAYFHGLLNISRRFRPLT